MTKISNTYPLLDSPRGDACRRLLARRIITPDAVAGESVGITRGFLRDHSCRREVYRALGRYFREEEARDILREAERHAWLEAEKAGRDIWRERDPRAPLGAAMRDWFGRHFQGWAAARRPQTAPAMC